MPQWPGSLKRSKFALLHLPLQHLEAVHLPLNLAVGLRCRDRHQHCCFVRENTPRESADF